TRSRGTTTPLTLRGPSNTIKQPDGSQGGSMPRIPFVVLIALALPVDQFAQTTFATITGLVTDPNGAVIAGAQVTAKRTNSNYRYTARSNEVGYYTLGQLLEGEYLLQAEAPGFKSFVVRDVNLAAQSVRRIDVRMELGAVETTVEVVGGATQIETEKARISDTKWTDIINSLPLNTRSLNTFLGQTAVVRRAVSTTP